jgi:small subunit ribosomal protein S9
LADNQILAKGTGRRKTSVARVFLKTGNGEITVNNRTVEDYFKIEGLINVVKSPLAVTDNLEKYSVLINVKGGGYNSQGSACVHGLARALTALDESNRGALKANGFLTRDSRMVERKKYGRKGARRKFQFSKR